ncbi:MAG: hypothetical protein AUI53_03575 [Acidobacteria bacterium 13_1_40CM_2_60_7]|nr:MAG: hypothetical protein AUI53_03575 [Acidobacteria bacterium 13_1_40CM_2_60_7]PYU09005.1 MAG: hypothetical protein DMG33_00010 [Acidobacteriota bacterium]
MSALIIGLVLVAAALLLWLLWQSAQRRRDDVDARARMEQLQRDLQTLAGHTQSFTQQFGVLGQTVAQRLESVTQALQKGVTDSAQIAAQAQSAMSGELKNSREMIGQVQKQLGEVQQAGREMALATQTLQNVLGGAKTRGLLGEITLERLLADALPSAHYQMQFRFSTGEAADAVIFLRDKLLPIDSKFPLDSYRRLGAEGDEARKAFAVAVKGHADAIAKKYIVPGENTLDIAMMFVPSESVYYELLMSEDSKGQALDAYCRDRNVIAVSPNTLYAHLQVILMGLRGMQIEENAKRLHASLAGLEKQLSTISEVYEKLGTHLKNAQQSYSEIDKRLERTQTTLGQMLEGTATETPALPAESSVKRGASS